MSKPLALIGAPSSAGAYAPGQEKSPAALRAAGILERLRKGGVDCADFGDVDGFRWRADPESPRAMHVAQVVRVAKSVADLVERAISRDHRIPLVVGGDCTVELGTVSGVLRTADNVGLIYFDLDADMNTPQGTTDGALDWMGVAHMLNLDATVAALAELAGRKPMLPPNAVLLFGIKNISAHEQEAIDRLGIKTIHAGAVAANPPGAAHEALEWAKSFEKTLLHFDVDAIDYEDFPIAENVRRKVGLKFNDAMTAFHALVSSGELAATTICEINPDHGREDGSTLMQFAERVARAFAGDSGDSYTDR